MSSSRAAWRARRRIRPTSSRPWPTSRTSAGFGMSPGLHPATAHQTPRSVAGALRDAFTSSVYDDHESIESRIANDGAEVGFEVVLTTAIPGFSDIFRELDSGTLQSQPAAPMTSRSPARRALSTTRTVCSIDIERDGPISTRRTWPCPRFSVSERAAAPEPARPAARRRRPAARLCPRPLPGPRHIPGS